MKRNIKHVWFAKVTVIFKNDTNTKTDIESISGPQLMCLANELGQIPINNLKKFFPNIKTLAITYVATKVINPNSDDSSDDSSDESSNDSSDKSSNKDDINNSDDSGYEDETLSQLHLSNLELISKIIDIESKKDIISETKCFLGRIQL